MYTCWYFLFRQNFTIIIFVHIVLSCVCVGLFEAYKNIQIATCEKYSYSENFRSQTDPKFYPESDHATVEIPFLSTSDSMTPVPKWLHSW